ncbi:uncharacterized protein LOC130949310 [Arachis stenosperma]|uniref:uncharacterized protein LOC130949310 n=1 Tax=Arachis stenosperma TaxID=217475 RepID=UPI0025AD9162|nr:uncharacterized protein LOC130949310 [Arachis stenosperma]
MDKFKHCAFHQKFGHTTDECVMAKDLLERLARQGLLDKYVDGRIQQRQPRTGGNQPENTNAQEKVKYQPSQTRGLISRISGGCSGGGLTSSARKRTYRAMLVVEGVPSEVAPQSSTSTITFEHSNYQAKATNLDGPVVISIQAGNLLVRKVFLDPCNNVDVLIYSTFQKMKLAKR